LGYISVAISMGLTSATVM